ncbi:MAG TPA: hypothetical protein VK083_23270, partial [Nocardia sp.]|nr:hypothetical protein [Nocardia sp.]
PNRLDRIELSQVTDNVHAMGRFAHKHGDSLYMCYVEVHDWPNVRQRLLDADARYTPRGSDPVTDPDGGWIHPKELHGLLLGVSRTTLAMARDAHLPSALSAVHPRFGVPHRAELAVCAVVAGAVLLVDLRAAIGFSSFTVLAYYLVANVSAGTLSVAEGRPARWIPVLGAGGCAVVASALPLSSVLAGAAVMAVGAGWYAFRRQR